MTIITVKLSIDCFPPYSLCCIWGNRYTCRGHRNFKCICLEGKSALREHVPLSNKIGSKHIFALYIFSSRFSFSQCGFATVLRCKLKPVLHRSHVLPALAVPRLFEAPAGVFSAPGFKRMKDLCTDYSSFTVVLLLVLRHEHRSKIFKWCYQRNKYMQPFYFQWTLLP